MSQAMRKKCALMSGPGGIRWSSGKIRGLVLQATIWIRIQQTSKNNVVNRNQQCGSKWNWEISPFSLFRQWLNFQTFSREEGSKNGRSHTARSPGKQESARRAVPCQDSFSARMTCSSKLNSETKLRLAGPFFLLLLRFSPHLSSARTSGNSNENSELWRWKTSGSSEWVW